MERYNEVISEIIGEECIGFEDDTVIEVVEPPYQIIALPESPADKAAEANYGGGRDSPAI